MTGSHRAAPKKPLSKKELEKLSEPTDPSKLKTGTLDARQADRELFNALERVKDAGKPKPRTLSQKVLEGIRGFLKLFGGDA